MNTQLQSQPAGDRRAQRRVSSLILAYMGATACLALCLAALAPATPARADGLVDLTSYAVWLSSDHDYTQSIAWGDVDGDGDLDLAAGSGNALPDKVYLNVGGVLQTSAAWTSGDRDYTWSVAWGDMDGDGDLDLATGNDGVNKVYLNVGGMLQTSAAWASSDSNGDLTYNVAWGDVDGDGDLDLAAGNNGQPNKIYLNVGGTLQTSAAWASDDSDRTYSVAWGDVDGDGDLDLATGNYGQTNRVYLNVGGMLQTTPTWTSDDSDSTFSVAWGDVDGDGDLDLAAGNDGSIKVYLNVGGTLQTTPAWTSGDSNTASSVVWGDVDGDDDLDLAAGSIYGPNGVYLNVDGTLQTTAAWLSGDHDWTYSVAWGDMDGDGDLDLAAGNSGQPNKIYLNVSGTLQITPTWTSDDSDGTTSMAWGDMDRDSDLDLAASNDNGVPNRASVYQNVGGILQTSASWASNDAISSVAWGDVDGDGDLDLAAGSVNAPNKVYLNVDGTLQTTAAWLSGDSDWTTSVAWGDVDGDGDLDLAAGNVTYRDGYQDRGGQTKVYLNAGADLQTNAAWTSEDSDETKSVAWGDMDGDGDLDLAVGNGLAWSGIRWVSGQDKVYLNMGGMLQNTPAWTSGDRDYTQSVAWGDLDGDGYLDLATGNDGLNKVYLNVGGTLQTSPAWTSTDNDNTHSVAWGDVDGDGDLDLAAGNWNSPSKVYLNIKGTLQTVADNPWTSNGNDWSYSVAWGDVDSDGDLDLASGNYDHPNLLYGNTRDARLLPGSIPMVSVVRPGPNADMYSSPQIWSGIVPITYTLSDPQGDPVEFIRAWYSPDGGGCWYTATAASGVVTTHLGTTSFVTRTVRNMTPASIPDLSAITSALTLTPTDMIADLDVTLNLTHTFDSNLVITLTAPFSRSVRLVAGRGGSGSNFTNTVFDDEAATSVVSGSAPFSGRFRPEQTLAHFDGYSPQGLWTLAIADGVGGDTGRLLSWGITATLNSGAVYTYRWDVAGSGFFGQSDNVVFRIQEIPAVVTGTRNVTPGPYLYGAYASQTFPFRVRGTQVRVVSGTLPISNALVYRLPASQVEGGQPLADAAGRPFRTDGQGYLQGRGQIGLGDRLLALTPITRTESYTLYYTNGTPTPTGLDAYTVSQAGVQTVTVSAAHPLLLFDLDVSLEWDASSDPTYLEQLEFDLKQASEFLYDFTDGQVALGEVTVHQNGDDWLTSDVVIYATNRLRPLAIQGGLVFTPTEDPEDIPVPIQYLPGQVRMGAAWNRYGDPSENARLDWQLALAHELAHYLLFEEDTYLGLTDQNLLVPVDTSHPDQGCTGSAMGDVYQDDNSEFLDTSGWEGDCLQTLAHRILGRSEWATIQAWYPFLHGSDRTGFNPGPGDMPFALTTVQVLPPTTPTNALADPTFFIDYQGEEDSSSSSHAFLLRQETGGDYVIDLGNPVSGQDRVLARGAQPGDRLCVFDPPRGQFGCNRIEANGSDHLAMEQNQDWAPVIQISPVNTQTLAISVELSQPSPIGLEARLFPEYGWGSLPIPLEDPEGDAVYSGTFPAYPYPPAAGHVGLYWAGDDSPKAMAHYAVGGNPGVNPFSQGHGPFSQGHGPFSQGHGPFSQGHGPFVVSPDGQMFIYTPQPEFEEGDLYIIHGLAGVPDLPRGKVLIGQAYRLVSAGVPVQDPSVSFQYLGIDALKAQVDEGELRIHFWDGARWSVLETVVDDYYNMATARGQGDGVYALLAWQTVPTVTNYAPLVMSNEMTHTLVITGEDFLPPVRVVLEGSQVYTLPAQVISPSLRVEVPAGLPAEEYRLSVVNGDGGRASVPGTLGIFDWRADLCFYDFFESGPNQWERSGEWNIVTIPNTSNRAMTDSPAGNYGSAITPTLTHIAAITSPAFSLANCPSPILSFDHAYVLAVLGTSQDVARVEVSADDGATWRELARYTGGGIYSEPPLTAQETPGSEWTYIELGSITIALNAYTGTVRLRFSLEVDQDVSDKGWVIDNVEVKPGTVLSPDTWLYLPLILK
jgi:subtilisin-like proprotein convertase family protein